MIAKSRTVRLRLSGYGAMLLGITSDFAEEHCFSLIVEAGLHETPVCPDNLFHRIATSNVKRKLSSLALSGERVSGSNGTGGS